jgi:hypothetical protein
MPQLPPQILQQLQSQKAPAVSETSTVGLDAALAAQPPTHEQPGGVPFGSSPFDHISGNAMAAAPAAQFGSQYPAYPGGMFGGPVFGSGYAPQFRNNTYQAPQFTPNIRQQYAGFLPGFGPGGPMGMPSPGSAMGGIFGGYGLNPWSSMVNFRPGMLEKMAAQAPTPAEPAPPVAPVTPIGPSSQAIDPANTATFVQDWAQSPMAKLPSIASPFNLGGSGISFGRY